MKKYQTISITPGNLENSHESIVNEKMLMVYLDGISPDKCQSFGDWLIGPTHDGSELFMWRLVK